MQKPNLGKTSTKKGVKTYKLWHVVTAFVVGAGIVGLFAFTPAFGMKGFSRLYINRTGAPSTSIQVQRDLQEKSITAMDGKVLNKTNLNTIKRFR